MSNTAATRMPCVMAAGRSALVPAPAGGDGNERAATLVHRVYYEYTPVHRKKHCEAGKTAVNCGSKYGLYIILRILVQGMPDARTCSIPAEKSSS